jgi:hypothetical protein
VFPMVNMFVLMGFWCAIIVVLEFLLWQIFRAKLVRISLPMLEHKNVWWRSVSILQLRIFAIVHTLLMVGVVVLLHVTA